jgi:hypothetical protein
MRRASRKLKALALTPPKLPAPKNFLLAGHINQTLALLPKGG